MSIYFSIPFFVLVTCVLASFAAGAIGEQEVLISALILTVGGGAVMWNIQQYGRGSAVMDSSELVVRTRGWTQRYNWLDVEDVLLTSFAERGSAARLWARVLHWPEREPFVELKLNRALRTGLSPGRYGTRLKGIPLIGGERVALFVDEPESFVRFCKIIRNVGKSIKEPASADARQVLQDGTNTYVYGLDLISSTDGAGNQTYYTYDGLGSTTDLTDGNSNVTGAYSYDVFGAIRSQTGGGSNYWQFTGEQRDSDSGAYYLRNRYGPKPGWILTRFSNASLPKTVLLFRHRSSSMARSTKMPNKLPLAWTSLHLRPPSSYGTAQKWARRRPRSKPSSSPTPRSPVLSPAEGTASVPSGRSSRGGFQHSRIIPGI